MLKPVCCVLQWGLVLAAVWVSFSGVATIERSGQVGVPSSTVAAEEVVPTTEQVALAELEGLWGRSLRETLIEPVPEPAPPPKPPPPPRPVALPKLVATFVEHGQAWGVFVDQKGHIRVRAVAQRVDDFVIAAIETGEVTLKRAGRLHKVEVPVERPRAQRRRGRSRW